MGKSVMIRKRCGKQPGKKIHLVVLRFQWYDRKIKSMVYAAIGRSSCNEIYQSVRTQRYPL